MNRQFLRFIFAGGFAATANFGSRFLFNRWLGYEHSIILAYLVGMLVAFTLMRGQVFKAKKKSLIPQVIKFVIVNMLAVLQTLGISIGLVRWGFPYSLGNFGLVIPHAEASAHLVGVLVPVVTSYFGHKFLTFR